MSKERMGYRENLQDILEFTEGRRLLTYEDVKKYTGIGDNRTVRRRFPYFVGSTISAATLALCLCGGTPRGLGE